VNGVRIKNVQIKKLKHKFVVLRVISIINLIKLVVTMVIGVVWVAVKFGGTNTKILV
jgi:hypothetical protein